MTTAGPFVTIGSRPGVNEVTSTSGPGEDVLDPSPVVRVLAVDDDEVVLRGVTRSLRGFDVTAVTDPLQALSFIEKGVHFDIVLTDQNMPGLTGVELLQRISEHGREIPGVLLTGAADLTGVIEAVNAGRIVRYLTKPTSPTVLQEVLSDVVAHDRQERVDAIERRLADFEKPRAGDETPAPEPSVRPDDGLQVLYQPIVDLRTRAPIGIAAWCRPTSEPPSTVFGRVRDVRAAIDVERRAVEMALRALGDLPEPMRLWLPVAAAGLDDDLLALLDGAAGRVVLEISEQDDAVDDRELRRSLAPFREAGVQVAIDELGVGASPLRRVAELTPDAMKLDRILVTGVGTDPVRRRLVDELRRFADDIDASLVAAGLERAEDRDALLALGVQFGQGDLLADSEPSPSRWVDHPDR